jgi:hypothetical protein
MRSLTGSVTCLHPPRQLVRKLPTLFGLSADVRALTTCLTTRATLFAFFEPGRPAHVVISHEPRSRYERFCRYAALSGLISITLPLVTSELLIRGRPPTETMPNVLKGVDSAVCATTAVLVLQRHVTSVAAERLQIRRRYQIETAKWRGVALTAITRPVFWLETLVVLLHLPPYCTFVFSASVSGNIVLYRAETLECAFALLRIYLFWPLLEQVSPQYRV